MTATDGNVSSTMRALSTVEFQMKNKMQNGKAIPVGYEPPPEMPAMNWDKLYARKGQASDAAKKFGPRRTSMVMLQAEEYIEAQLLADAFNDAFDDDQWTEAAGVATDETSPTADAAASSAQSPSKAGKLERRGSISHTKSQGVHQEFLHQLHLLNFTDEESGDTGRSPRPKPKPRADLTPPSLSSMLNRTGPSKTTSDAAAAAAAATAAGGTSEPQAQLLDPETSTSTTAAAADVLLAGQAGASRQPKARLLRKNTSGLDLGALLAGGDSNSGGGGGGDGAEASHPPRGGRRGSQVEYQQYPDGGGWPPSESATMLYTQPRAGAARRGSQVDYTQEGTVGGGGGEGAAAPMLYTQPRARRGSQVDYTQDGNGLAGGDGGPAPVLYTQPRAGAARRGSQVDYMQEANGGGGGDAPVFYTQPRAGVARRGSQADLSPEADAMKLRVMPRSTGSEGLGGTETYGMALPGGHFATQKARRASYCLAGDSTQQNCGSPPAAAGQHQAGLLTKSFEGTLPSIGGTAFSSSPPSVSGLMSQPIKSPFGDATAQQQPQHNRNGLRAPSQSHLEASSSSGLPSISPSGSATLPPRGPLSDSGGGGSSNGGGSALLAGQTAAAQQRARRMSQNEIDSAALTAAASGQLAGQVGAQRQGRRASACDVAGGSSGGGGPPSSAALAMSPRQSRLGHRGGGAETEDSGLTSRTGSGSPSQSASSVDLNDPILYQRLKEISGSNGCATNGGGAAAASALFRGGGGGGANLKDFVGGKPPSKLRPSDGSLPSQADGSGLFTVAPRSRSVIVNSSSGYPQSETDFFRNNVRMLSKSSTDLDEILTLGNDDDSSGAVAATASGSTLSRKALQASTLMTATPVKAFAGRAAGAASMKFSGQGAVSTKGGPSAMLGQRSSGALSMRFRDGSSSKSAASLAAAASAAAATEPNKPSSSGGGLTGLMGKMKGLLR